MKRIIAIVLPCLFVYSFVKGQVPDYKESVLSPQVMLMNMYGNYPVNLANGLVDISIPLYEIKTPSLTLPISAKFHASGLKANEQEGLLGVRWFLDATYAITRSIKGYADDFPIGAPRHFPFDSRVSTPYYIPDLSTLYATTWIPDKDYATAIPQYMLQWLSEYSGPPSDFMDTEYDIFSYHLPSGKTGKFILRDSAGIRIPCTLPYEPIKIEVKRPYPTGIFKQFTITDENGIMYIYGTRSGETSESACWNLDSIISANKNDTIAFEYNFISHIRIRNRIATGRIVRDEINFSLIPGGPTPSDIKRQLIQNFFDEECRFNPGYSYISLPSGVTRRGNLSAIRFKGGRIEFNNELLYGSVFISSMNILNTTSLIPVKKITFSYWQPDIPSRPSAPEEDKAVLLDKITIEHTLTGITGETYKFDYYNPELFPAGSSLQTEIQADWWGYFLRGGYDLIRDDVRYHTLSVNSFMNGINNSYPAISTIGEATVDKNSKTVDMKVCMLKSIEYPTGGKTIYDYESNYYTNRITHTATSCGGLRVKSVENIGTDGRSERKTYRYNPHINGLGIMPDHLHPPRSDRDPSKNFITETAINNAFMLDEYDGCDFNYASYLYSNVLPGQFTDFHSNIVYYNKVVEYQGTEAANDGYTEYNYETIMPMIDQYNHHNYANQYLKN